MNYMRTTKNLQRALAGKGIVYKIGTYQFYSVNKKMFVTGYSVTEKQAYVKKNGEMSVKDVELVKTYSQVDLLKWFADEWEKVKNDR